MVSITISADTPKEAATALRAIAEPPLLAFQPKNLADAITNLPTRDTCEESSYSGPD